MDHPRSAFVAPLKGATVHGSEPTCVGLDGPKNSRVSRPRGLQGTPVARQSRFHGVRVAAPLSWVVGGASAPGGMT